MPETRAEEAAARLRATATELIDEVRGLPADVITWIPSEGVWSVMDNLCHIREFVPFWVGETVKMIGQPHELWGRDHTDGPRLAAVTDTARYVLDDVLADLAATTAAAATTIGAMSDEALATEATSRNPRWGLKPASFVVEHLIVGHVAKHLGQIRRNVAQFNAQGGPSRA